MTNQEIDSIIRQLNCANQHLQNRSIIRPIAPHVDWGYVWPEDEDAHEHAELFLVKDDTGQYVAAVHRPSENELHWYVLEESRRRGVLVEPLRAVILPFILSHHNEPEQKCSVAPDSRFGCFSMKLAEKVGFRRTGECLHTAGVGRVVFVIGERKKALPQRWSFDRPRLLGNGGGSPPAPTQTLPRWLFESI